jgi:hypothetical protein
VIVGEDANNGLHTRSSADVGVLANIQRQGQISAVGYNFLHSSLDRKLPNQLFQNKKHRAHATQIIDYQFFRKKIFNT